MHTLNSKLIRINPLLFLIIAFICFLSSCHKKYSNIDKEISNNIPKIISINEITSVQDIDSIIESYKYLKLETNKECLIGRIEKILISNNKIFILDGVSNSILVYKNNGDFDFKINRKGKGPGEYDKIFDFEIVEDKEQLVVLCTNFRKLLFYSIHNGAYLEEKKMKFGALAFMRNNSGKYLFDCKIKMDRESNSNRLIITDSMLNITEGYFPRTNHPSIERTPFTKNANAVFYSSNYDNHVYSYRRDTLFREYLIDFGNMKLDISSLPEKLFTSRGICDKRIVPFLNYKKFSNYLINKDIAYDVSTFLETDNFIRFKFTYKGNIINVIHDKETGNTRTYKAIKQISDLCFDFVTLVHDNYFVGCVDSYILAESIKESNLKLFKDKLKNLGINDSISTYDNPALIFIEYRRF